MAITGSSSSVTIPEAAPATTSLVVGMATRNHAATAAAAVRSVQAELARHDPALNWRLVVADTGSTDGTLERIREAIGAGGALTEIAHTTQPADALDLPYHGLPGRARALHAIFREAHAQRARACVVIDARAGAFAPGWIEHVVPPLVAGAADYLAPVYAQHPYTRGLIHGIVYPVFRALYGLRLRYPLGADSACSDRFIEAILPDLIWETEAGQRGIDLWIAATAATGAFRVGQAVVGPRPGEARQEVDLSTAIAHVLGALFADMQRRAHIWQRVRGSRAVPQFGSAAPTPDAPEVDPAPLAESFRLGHRELQDVWAEVLPPLAVLQWRRLASAPLDGFRVDDTLWARTVYDFAMGHRLRVIARDHLLQSLAPLYLAWLASFVRETRQAPAAEAEVRLERLCLAFEAEKPYLVSQWRWPERFRPVRLRR